MNLTRSFASFLAGGVDGPSFSGVRLAITIMVAAVLITGITHHHLWLSPTTMNSFVTPARRSTT